MAQELTRVRPASQEDLLRILSIYNHEVLFSTATYDTQPRTKAEQEQWFAHHDSAHPVLVAESRMRHSAASTLVVCGWASLSPWSDRPAYDTSVEVSVYVAEEHRKKGIGKLLLQALIEAGRAQGHHALLGRISSDNAVSIRLHESLGFTVAGVLKEVGFKFGRWLDVSIMELLI
ncbi:MAG: GNAT family N-acetyltransferase [Spirochaetia bacterium]